MWPPRAESVRHLPAVDDVRLAHALERIRALAVLGVSREVDRAEHAAADGGAHAQVGEADGGALGLQQLARRPKVSEGHGRREMGRSACSSSRLRRPKVSEGHGRREICGDLGRRRTCSSSRLRRRSSQRRISLATFLPSSSWNTARSRRRHVVGVTAVTVAMRVALGCMQRRPRAKEGRRRSAKATDGGSSGEIWGALRRCRACSSAISPK